MTEMLQNERIFACISSLGKLNYAQIWKLLKCLCLFIYIFYVNISMKEKKTEKSQIQEHTWAEDILVMQSQRKKI